MSHARERIHKQFLETERTFGAMEIPLSMPAETESKIETGTDPDSSRWDDAKKAASVCTKCRLCETRTHVVFGEGNERADLMFVGEGPGYEEDIQGRPFVGKAGGLLTKIIEAMGLERSDVYIANCVKCRPPQNRNPYPDEIALCQPYLVKQIEHIQPKVICALGKFAAQTLLGTETPISRLRGKFHDWRGIRVMPTFHPAYLLRNPADKRLVWEDAQQIMKVLGLQKPAR